jgi:hypothetical protein
MAKTDFPLSIDRRRLLTSAAAITATGVVPDVNPANSATAREFVQLPQVRSEAGPASVSAATARRLLEIARRNEIRREANLPSLSIPKELRRMKDQEELGDFEGFEAFHGKAVWDELLKTRREAEGPNWRPSWTEGLSYQTQVNKILREQFHAARRVASLNSGAADA